MDFLPDLNTLREYMEMGGFVMPPLVAVAVVLWYALIWRMTVVRTTAQDPRVLVDRVRRGKRVGQAVTARAARQAVALARAGHPAPRLRSLIRESFGEVRTELSRYRALVRSLVVVAPLLGLLGTVDGMIATFEALGDMALFSQSGGIADGISRALFTTQMGLVISIPGILVGRSVERRQRHIERELDQICDQVCAEVA